MIEVPFNLRNRNTKFFIAGFILAVIGVPRAAVVLAGSKLEIPLLGVAIILFAAGLIIEDWGVRKTRHFCREDAQEILEHSREQLS